MTQGIEVLCEQSLDTHTSSSSVAKSSQLIASATLIPY